ncbi:hypothetical protein FGG08_000320 [Glutinoglossum americanum]|uniref:Uncharacterized protein n=1 Tax=Glutinoglossum americanum TaxID=1670608 RepID=A0A9P8I4A3_9PEZI|nr:hypothetical protein FGG08_000320 [Glutinoglossum americanum]
MEFSVTMVRSPTGSIPVPTSQMLFSDVPHEDAWDPADLVEAFNALPRNRYVPTDKIPNKWHFSLHTIPTHGVVVFLVNPYCQFIHIEALPPYSRELRESSGISDSNQLMNLMIACSLMKAFVENFEDRSMPPVGRPWSWVTTNTGRASEVEAALKDLGVRKPSCKVSVADDKERVLAEQAWNRFQGASEWGDGSGVLGAPLLVGSLPSMAAAARLADAEPRRNSRCAIL